VSFKSVTFNAAHETFVVNIFFHAFILRSKLYNERITLEIF